MCPRGIFPDCWFYIFDLAVPDALFTSRTAKSIKFWQIIQNMNRNLVKFTNNKKSCLFFLRKKWEKVIDYQLFNGPVKVF
jgi:hypothetical protein